MNTSRNEKVHRLIPAGCDASRQNDMIVPEQSRSYFMKIDQATRYVK
jgi:hypothetical protein